MLKLYNYEGNTVLEAYEKCLKELNSTEQDLYIRTHEKQKSELFKSKKYVVEAMYKKEVVGYIKNYLDRLAYFMNIQIDCEIIEQENSLKIQLNSNNNSILIGKEGKTVQAIQTLVKQSLKNITTFYIKIDVDVADYQENKKNQLIKTVEKIIEEVRTSKIRVKLDSMTSYERHIVHDIATKYNNIKTHSEANEPNRYIVIEYIEENK